MNRTDTDKVDSKTKNISKIGTDCIVYDDDASCEGNQHYEIAAVVDVEREGKGDEFIAMQSIKSSLCNA